MSLQVNKVATLTGHRDCVYALEQGAAPYDIFSAAADGMVVAWDLRTPENGKLVAKVESSVYALRYLPESGYLIVGDNFNGIHLIDPKQNKEMASAAITEAAIFDVQANEQWLFVATGDGSIVLMRKDNLAVEHRVKLSDKSVRAIALHPEKKILAAAYSDAAIRIFSTQNMQLIQEIPAHQNSVFTVTFSPDGLYLLSGSRDAHLKSWKVEEQFKESQSVVAHMYAINHVQFSPSGKFFVTASMDKSIKVWDAAQMKLLKVIDKARHAGHGTSVNKLLWTTYHEQIISCSDDRTISVWEFVKDDTGY